MTTIDFSKDAMIKLHETIEYFEKNKTTIESDIKKAIKYAKELQKYTEAHQDD